MKRGDEDEISQENNVRNERGEGVAGYIGVGWGPHHLFAQNKMFGTPTDSLAQRCNPEIK